MTFTASPTRVHRIVGVIGGMGPEATVDLMRRVIAKTHARDDEDHIHLIVESNPKIPSRVKHLLDGTGADPTPELVRIAQNLERAGADALAMPCNTAHSYASAIVNAVSIPLLDMVKSTVAEIASRHPQATVGLLASTAVHRTKVFDDGLRAADLSGIVSDRQSEVMGLITAVKQGETGARVQQTLAEIAGEMSRRCGVVLIACSELSVIASAISVPFVDSLDILASQIVRFAEV